MKYILMAMCVVIGIVFGLSIGHPIYIPAYAISIEGTPFNFTLISNQTILGEICGNPLSIGCTNENYDIWIYTNQSKYSFEVTCNHEVLHNILDYPSNESEWGSSDEHKIIIPIQEHTHTPECNSLIKKVWG